MAERFRIAPTPSGYLHLGNAVNAALTAALAAAHDAGLTLRLDDLDAARVRPAYRRDVDEVLAWLLPAAHAAGAFATPLRQSARLDRYALVLGGLRQNDLVFACACTRRQLAAARGTDAPPDVNRYPGTCRDRGLDLDAPGVAWRMRDSGLVVRQKDGRPSYQLASLTDDLDLGVTHLVRGDDLRASTALQRDLAHALAALPPGRLPADGPDFAHFAAVRAWHHPLLTGPDGAKLSKSAGATSVRALREAGAGPERVFAAAGRLVGVEGVRSLAGLTEAVGARPPAWG